MKNPNKVLIINTGGTIGMKSTPNGYAPASGYLLGELEKIDDLSRDDMPRWDFVEMDPLLDSSNVSSPEWNKIGRLIFDNYQKYSGFVILHGTDTMSYTASALSFMLEGLCKPVVLTGSQIPLAEIRSDARDNLITSMLIASAGVVKEVCLCFGGKLLRGNRSTKTSADNLLAFDSPNYPHLADVGITIRYNLGALKTPKEGKLTFSPFGSVPICVLKIFPGMQFGLFENIITSHLSGVVLESFGSGNIPDGGKELASIISKAYSNGSVVVVCSQCLAGTVQLGAYQTSAVLKNAGAISGADMTTEAAVTKLYYLFSKKLARSQIKQLMESDLAGELSAI